MLTSGVNGNGAPKWSPAPYVPPAAMYQATRAPASPSLGETASISAAESVFRSPMLAFGTSVVAAAAGAYLAYGLNKRRNICLRWATEPASKVVGKDRDGRDIHGGGETLERALEKCPSTTWVTLWWIVATAMGVKALHDLSEMNA